jgi:hypothetical protein
MKNVKWIKNQEGNGAHAKIGRFNAIVLGSPDTSWWILVRTQTVGIRLPKLADVVDIEVKASSIEGAQELAIEEIRKLHEPLLSDGVAIAHAAAYASCADWLEYEAGRLVKSTESEGDINALTLARLHAEMTMGFAKKIRSLVEMYTENEASSHERSEAT